MRVIQRKALPTFLHDLKGFQMPDPSIRSQPLVVAAGIIVDDPQLLGVGHHRFMSASAELNIERAANSAECQILIAQRFVEAKIEGGLWEFPGGKVEYLESPEACLKREIFEELALEIDVLGAFDIASHIYADSRKRAAKELGSEATTSATTSARTSACKEPLHIVLLCFICTPVGGRHAKFVKRQVQDARWVRVSELGSFNFAAADRATVRKLLQTP